jgi:hypothetical protein
VCECLTESILQGNDRDACNADDRQEIEVEVAGCRVRAQMRKGVGRGHPDPQHDNLNPAKDNTIAIAMDGS